MLFSCESTDLLVNLYFRTKNKYQGLMCVGDCQFTILLCVWNTRQVSNLPHFEKNCRPRPHVKEFLTLCWTKLFVSFGTLQYKSRHELPLDTKDHARICCIYSAVTTQQIYSTNNKQYRHLSMQRSRIFKYVPKQNLSWLIF